MEWGIKENVISNLSVGRETELKTKGTTVLSSEIALSSKADKIKRVPVLKCGVVMLQNFVEEYGEPGRQLKLIREPDNPHDRWATKVCTHTGTVLGYLPSRKNQSVARLMDAGKTITVFVDEISHIHEKGYFLCSRESDRLPLTVYLDITG